MVFSASATVGSASATVCRARGGAHRASGRRGFRAQGSGSGVCRARGGGTQGQWQERQPAGRVAATSSRMGMGSSEDPTCLTPLTP